MKIWQANIFYSDYLYNIIVIKIRSEQTLAAFLYNNLNCVQNKGNYIFIKETKSTDDYRSYNYYEEFGENGYAKYYDGMYLYSTRKFKDGNRLVSQGRTLREDPIGEISEVYLRKIIEHCQQEDISITLFISPMDNLLLISTLDYDNYINQVREIAAEYNVEFYDFNLIKQQYLNLDKHTCFHDNNHLNASGVNLFNPVLHQVLTSNAEQNYSLFYTTYAEMLANTDPDFYGLYSKDAVTEDGKQITTYHIASNRNNMEYRIIITPNEDEQYWLQDFNTNASFTLPTSEHGICTIIARMKENPEEIIQTMEIGF
ncbi:MAG: hypothetical protein J6A08_10065 [Lachnospiraceae bacterium]|nr:hypothetical protein [Lachnospiraceae bacterium]